METAAGSTAAPVADTGTPTEGNSAPVESSASAPPKEVKADKAVSAQAQKVDPELYDIVIDGKPEKLTLQELKNHASMVKAATKRFEEAAKMRKENEEFDQLSQKDMIAALKRKGFSNEQIRDQMESWYKETFIDPETLTPEQRKLKEYEAKLKKYEDEEQEKVSKAKQEEEDKLTATQREHLQSQIIDALEKSGLPKTPAIAARMAFYMRENLLRGWDAPVDVIVQQVQKEREEHYKSEVGTLKGEQLVKYLGENVVNEIRKYDVAVLRARKQNIGSNNSVVNPDAGSNEKVSSSEVTRRLKEIRLGRM